MLGRLTRSAAFARGALTVLALGLFALAGLAMYSTATTTETIMSVQRTGDRAGTWDEFFDHVNLEQDLMHSYLSTPDESHRQSLVHAIGGGMPTLTLLTRSAENPQEREQATAVGDAYEIYSSLLRRISRSDLTVTQRNATSYNSEFAASSLRRQVVACKASERGASSTYLRSVSDISGRLEMGAGASFVVCLVLLASCTAILIAHQRRVEHQATHDSLTGLANRDLFAQRVAGVLRGAQRRHEHVGLLLLDLDRFKEVNDTLGHHAGDSLLRQVADRLTAWVPEDALVARLGGDEFAVLLPGTGSLRESAGTAERLFRVLLAPIDLGPCEVDVSSSIGVVGYPEHGEDADDLMRFADIAMYTAKRRGVGVMEYDASQNSYDPRQLALSAELRHAIETGALALHYQPQVHVASGGWRGVEALVRWHHPRRGLIGPGEFVPLAEQSGLVDQLTDWVLATALNQYARWLDLGIDVPISVNISAHSLGESGHLLERVEVLLQTYEVPPAVLTLEITESAIIANPQGTISLLERIRARGVHLSLDDFGTGYSSMAYLQQLPIDELKIDRQFLARITTDESSVGIVQAVLDLSRHLHLSTVAEGVEDEATLRTLADLGCEACQGYFLSRPLPVDTATEWLRAHPRWEPTVPVVAHVSARHRRD